MKAAQGRKGLFWFTVHPDGLQGGRSLKKLVTLQKAEYSEFMLFLNSVFSFYSPRNGGLSVFRQFCLLNLTKTISNRPYILPEIESS